MTSYKNIRNHNGIYVGIKLKPDIPSVKTEMLVEVRVEVRVEAKL